ncbi:phosphate ABC transporter substrate-binding/OmpA family protein [Yoonia sp.]|uniref:phosphate ABC transporter substrate-binding/OmpA family protein n=1 Tax=Yoonia sp. TaxID=2212373 RepID=UPI0025F94239|nr:phosphate ABC transporter substrate-binding/OmpA family protein [Yoonia sp.]
MTLAAPSFAEEVTLRSLDGSNTLKGDFVSYDGATYTIRTLVGEFQVDGFQVTCSGAACPTIDVASEAFTIAGSSKLVGRVFSDLIFEFSSDIGGGAATLAGDARRPTIQIQDEAERDLAQITLDPVGSKLGIASVVAGDAKLAVATRSVTADEVALFAGAGLGDPTSALQEKIFALDGLVAITSQTNPIRAISEENLASIFAGKITNWSEIGGPSAAINLYFRTPDSGTAAVFNDLVMVPAGAALSSGARFVETDAAVASAVAADPLGIGITGLADAGAAKVLAIRGVCGIQVPATPFTIKTEEYPLSRRIYAYNGNNDVPAQLGRFIKFLDTAKAQDVVSNAGFVDLGISYQNNNEQGLRFISSVMPTDVEVDLAQLQQMSEALIASDRTSITFRFALGSATLDARAQDDIVRLANLVTTGDIKNKEMLLIGFTDSVGAGASNIGLSQQRADEVRQALVAAAPASSLDGVPIRALGFGEISPLSCNETANGRRINRRVEVWFRDIVTVSP